MSRLSRSSILLAVALMASPAWSGETTTYAYDALGRLTGVGTAGGPASGQASSIAYDPAGNRSNVTVTGVGAPPSFSVDSLGVTEGGTAVSTVTKFGAVSGTLTEDYAAANGSALAGADSRQLWAR